MPSQQVPAQTETTIFFISIRIIIRNRQQMLSMSRKAPGNIQEMFVATIDYYYWMKKHPICTQSAVSSAVDTLSVPYKTLVSIETGERAVHYYIEINHKMYLLAMEQL